MAKTPSYKNFVKKSEVRNLVKAADMRISGDTFAQLDRAIHTTVTNAIARAKNDRRKTVQPADVA